MKVIKTDHRTNLQVDTLNDLMEICVEGPPFTSLSADQAVELWWSECNATRRFNQHYLEKEYRPRASSTSQDDEEETPSTTPLQSTLET